MGRFVNSTAGNPSFSNAQVFTSSTTWTVPSGVNVAKVYVIGAGSCFRNTCVCMQGIGCCSGVVTPVCNYCFNFAGQLTGAGGGYAEKTMVDLQPGATMTITVGAIGGSSASSVSIGSYNVVANNATEVSYSWACVNNSTARSNASDNPISMGFALPVCGYVNCISGYWNFGGTATGGDVNRTGGRGVLIPYFNCESCVDGCVTIQPTTTITGGGGGYLCSCTNQSWTGNSYDYGFGGNRYTCMCINVVLHPWSYSNSCCGYCWSPNYGSSLYCYCHLTYHTTFGSQCSNGTWQNCLNYYVPYCLCGTYLCLSSGSSATVTVYNCYVGDVYAFAGNAMRCCIGGNGGDWGQNQGWQTTSLPVGVGAEAGNSGANGNNGQSEVQIYKQNTPALCSPTYYTSSGGSGGSTNLVCYQYWPCDAFYFVFGYSCGCTCYAYNSGTGAGPGTGTGQPVQINCYNIGYYKDETLYKPVVPGVIPLSTLKAPGCTNINDFKFGYGATTLAAGYGGGGNRLNTAGGNGAVIVVY
jgi:hypothetical protein